MIVEFTDKNFKDTEKKLRLYYQNPRKIKELEYRCKILEEQRDNIYKDMKDINILIDPDLGLSIGISERVQTSPKWGGYTENKMISQMQKLYDEWVEVRKKILKIHAEIRELKMQTIDIGFIIERLDDEDRNFIKLKYGSGRDISNVQLAFKTYSSESGVRRKKKKLLSMIYRELLKGDEVLTRK